MEHNPEIAPLQTEFEALQAEFEKPKRDFEAKRDEWSERAEPVWKAMADDLEPGPAPHPGRNSRTTTPRRGNSGLEGST